MQGWGQACRERRAHHPRPNSFTDDSFSSTFWQQGSVPFLVSATSGTTVLGAFDPLDAIADVCQRHGLWFHVDVSETRVEGVGWAPLRPRPTLFLLLHRLPGVGASCCPGHTGISWMGSRGAYSLLPESLPSNLWSSQ